MSAGSVAVKGLCDECGRLLVSLGVSPAVGLYRAVSRVSPDVKKLCGVCLDDQWEEFLELRRRHEALVRSGVHPKIAGKVVLRGAGL